jgi:hypothetical protein
VQFCQIRKAVDRELFSIALAGRGECFNISANFLPRICGLLGIKGAHRLVGVQNGFDQVLHHKLQNIIAALQHFGIWPSIPLDYQRLFLVTDPPKALCLNHGMVDRFIFFKGTKMRATALAVLLCMSSGEVSAQMNEQCQSSTQRAGDLLHCYNRTAPPRAASKLRNSKASAAPNKSAVFEHPIAVDKPAEPKSTNPTDYVDVLADENSKLDAKMKTICRGC